MLTGTMNAADLHKVYECDKERLFCFLHHKETDLRRQLKKGFSKKCAKCYDYRTSNAEYKLSICAYSRRSIIDVYMYIKETNEYIMVTARANLYDDACLVFTPHYIRRMGERIYGDKDMEVNKILTYFILHSNTSINIYHDDRKYVFALQGGISLAQLDKKRNLMVMKTFVSTEMLKNTQIAAWERVASIIEHFDTLTEDEVGRNGFTSADVLYELSKEVSSLDLEEINNIYGDYFNKKEK